MTFGGKKATALLFLGDILVFALSLWLTLWVRYFAIPESALLLAHASAFATLFGIWILVFYMTGLYSKRVTLFKKELPAALIGVQLVNILIAVVFFFVMPVGIAPKTNLLLYLVVSVAAMLAWRLVVYPKVTRPAARERAALIGDGKEVRELAEEVNGNNRYHLSFPVVVTPEEVAADVDAFAKRLVAEKIESVVVDTESDALRPLLPRVYELAFVEPGYQFYDFYQLYEEVFDRVPLSLLQYDWFLKNVSSPSSHVYEFLKRAIDVAGGLAMGAVTVVILPLVWLALRLEGPGPLFIRQQRIGRYGVRVSSYKFRSMRYVDQGAWKGEGENYVTKVGAFLRLTSLDEFPQFINVLAGEISLVGPRNDIEALGVRLAEAIPYYNIRYIVKPGITGWAQINQRYEPGNISPQSIEETKVRLAYDFYYIKKRSFVLDMVIALKTVKRMFFRVSSW